MPITARLSHAPREFSITVLSVERHGNYNGVMLSAVLAREKTFEAITTHPRSQHEDNGIEMISGESVAGIDRDTKTATGELGNTRPYDMLLLVTGSNRVIIPVLGNSVWRDRLPRISDIETMMSKGPDEGCRSGRHGRILLALGRGTTRGAAIE